MIAPPPTPGIPRIYVEDIRHSSTPPSQEPYDETWESPAYDTAGAARLLGRTTKQVLALLKAGTLKGYRTGPKPGSRWYVYRWSIENVLAGGRGDLPVQATPAGATSLADDAEGVGLELIRLAARLRASEVR